VLLLGKAGADTLGAVSGAIPGLRVTKLSFPDATGWGASAVLGGLGRIDVARRCFSSGLKAW